MKKRPDINRFALLEYEFASFEPGAHVLDIGCGKGGQLLKLAGRGCQAVGLDPNVERARTCARLGLNVVVGKAEHLPFPDASFGGVICKGVIPYTSEAIAFREIARVLKPCGIAQIAYLSSGFYLRLFLLGQGGRIKQRIYGLRTFLNTWLFALTRRILPGVWGNTIYQSRRRLRKYYAENRLTLVCETPSKKFFGFSVFIYHTLQAQPASIKPVTAFSPGESEEALAVVAF